MLADRAVHAWAQRLDREAPSLGLSTLTVAGSGVYDAKLRIAVPAPLLRELELRLPITTKWRYCWMSCRKYMRKPATISLLPLVCSTADGFNTLS